MSAHHNTPNSNSSRKGLRFFETIHSFKLTHIWLVIIGLYFILWYLNPEKAGSMFFGIAQGAEQWTSWLTGPVSKSTSDLQTFLNTPNPKLFDKRNGFYKEKAGYYITVNTQKKSCEPRYSEKHQGYWNIPAKVLCPQVMRLLAGDSSTLTIEVTSGCEANPQEAQQRDWKCKSK